MMHKKVDIKIRMIKTLRVEVLHLAAGGIMAHKPPDRNSDFKRHADKTTLVPTNSKATSSLSL